ncbi:voltage-dependent calcium channel beta subunit-associated regulatory protein [Osmerus mordax]|uniref:voltage-dependent calcium channel beta subunit-associated regulatory protein n=1 Tax=Osmerus mordax TaxID=8014 RepID=UPI00350F3CBC
MSNDSPVLTSLTRNSTDLPVSAGRVENYVLLLVMLCVFAGGTLVLLSLVLLFCHRCCVGGRRYSRASDDPEKTNTTYVEDSQPTQEITIRLDESDALSVSSCHDGESERFLSAGMTGRRVSFNESALYEQEKKDQDKGRRYTLTEGDFHHLKKARLTHLHLAAPPSALNILTIMECESAGGSTVSITQTPPPKAHLDIYQPTERGLLWKGQSPSGGLPGDPHHSILMGPTALRLEDPRSRTLGTVGDSRGVEGERGTRGWRGTPPAPGQTSVLQFFSKLRRHASLEGAGPYFRKWKFDSSHRAASLDAKGWVQLLSAGSLSPPATPPSPSISSRVEVEAVVEAESSLSRTGREGPPPGLEGEAGGEAGARIELGGETETETATRTEPADAVEVWSGPGEKEEEGATAGVEDRMETSRRTEEKPAGAPEDGGPSQGRRGQDGDLSQGPRGQDGDLSQGPRGQNGGPSQGPRGQDGGPSQGQSQGQPGGAGLAPGLGLLLGWRSPGRGPAKGEDGGAEGGLGAEARRGSDSFCLSRQESSSLYRDIWSLRASLEQYASSDQSSTDRESVRSDADSICSLGGAGARAGLDSCLSQDLDDEPEGEPGDGGDRGADSREGEAGNGGGGGGGEGEGGGRKLLQMDSGYASIEAPSRAPEELRLFGAPGGPRGKTASERRLFFTSSGRKGSVCESFETRLFQEELEDQISLGEGASERGDSTPSDQAPPPASPHRPRLRRRDYSIDEKTDALFNEFLRHDPRFDQPDSPLRSRHRSRVHLRKQWQRHKQYSDPGARYSPSLERQRFTPLRRGESAGYPLDTRYHSTLSRIASAADEEANEGGAGEGAANEGEEGKSLAGERATGEATGSKGSEGEGVSKDDRESTNEDRDLGISTNEDRARGSPETFIGQAGGMDPRVDNRNNNSSQAILSEKPFTPTRPITQSLPSALPPDTHRLSTRPPHPPGGYRSPGSFTQPQRQRSLEDKLAGTLEDRLYAGLRRTGQSQALGLGQRECVGVVTISPDHSPV